MRGGKAKNLAGMLPFMLFFVCIFQLPLKAVGSGIFFDLNIDPNESDTALSSGTEYAAAYSTLVERSAYWADYVVDYVEVDQTYKKATWKKNSGVSAWLEDTFTPPEIPLLYNYSDAPNIVFVLVDDWGWNDVGYRSTYLNWTTPTIDRLAGEGVKLENYFTLYSCVPARGAFLTGRYPIRLGLWNQFDGAELPLSEITIGQEMQSAGYRTYLVGKWHQGFSTIQKTPAYRGFDSSYSYWNGFVDYWSKTYGLYLDLHNGEDLVTDADEVSSDLHNGILMETKAEAAIADHAANYSGQPMFLYYAMQLIHGVWDAPDSYLKRCGMPEGIADEYVRNVTYNYCALNVMLDEAVANLTCALEAHGMANNTILVLVSDNGGEQTVLGNSYPYIGNKGSFYRGGLSATGFIHSKLIPEAARGVPYYGQMHVTDWLPTLMGLATNNEWTGSLFGAELDGVDQWEAITVPGTDSPRHEIVHYHDGNSTSSIQIDMMKLNLGDELKPASNPSYVFTKDLAPENSAQTCALPSLIDDDESIFSHNLQFKVLELDISPTMQSSSGTFFSGYVAVAFIVFLITLVILMSIRMASVIGKQVDEIEVDRKRQERERVAEDGPHAGETSRLLI